MGQSFTFRCKSCGYSALVSGGSDAGMMVCTQTILCFDCQELTDVATSEFPEGKWVDVPLKCGTNTKHRVRPWKAPDVCPRCGGLMERSDGTVVQWD